MGICLRHACPDCPLKYVSPANPIFGVKSSSVMNVGNVELQKPMKSRVSSKTWGFGET
jgi:hypothetical protein